MNSAALPLEEELGRTIRFLEREHIDYMVVGSMASMIYGEPRLTRDLDIVLRLEPGGAGALAKLFPSPDYYCPPVDLISQELVNNRQINVIHISSGLKIDIIFRKNSKFARTEFERRQKVEVLPGLAMYMASPEDVVLKKLEFFREGQSTKHIDDIRGVMANTKMDMDYLAAWVETLGLAREWAECVD